jgi:polyferredoxin
VLIIFLIGHRVCCLPCAFLAGMLCNLAGTIMVNLVYFRLPVIPLVLSLSAAALSGGLGGLLAFKLLRWVFLLLSLFFTFWWILFLSGVSVVGNIYVISKIASYKYLSTELLMTMFFWVAFIGRGYCYYCPLGTVLSLLSKIAWQKIITDKTKCIQCSKCSNACPMSIDIKAKAQNGEAVADLRCVGCCHCVDVCPTGTLDYTTGFLDWIHKKSEKVLTE